MVVMPVALFVPGTLIPTVVTDLTRPDLSAASAAVGLAVWQIGVFLITAQRTILIVQGLVALMRDWLPRLPEKHRHEVHEITYSVDSTVTAARRRKLWLVTAAVAVLAFGGASVDQLRHDDQAGGRRRDVGARAPGLRRGRSGEHPPRSASRPTRPVPTVVEFDILQTKDLKFVVIHDTNLQRLAGINVNVKDLTQAELMKITVRADGMEAKIPSLEQWIAAFDQPRLPQLLEVKLHGGESPDLLPRLLAVLDRYKVTQFYTYHSISRQVVEESEAAASGARGRLHHPDQLRRRPEGERGLPRGRAEVPDDDDFRNEAWGKGYKVIVWTVNDEQAMRNYINDNVNGLITDRPDLGVDARDDIENDEGLSGRLVDMVVRSSSF